MNIDEWLKNKIVNSTSVNVYTTRCYPNYVTSTTLTPYVYYDTIGFEKNRILRNNIYQIVSCSNSKSSLENLNEALYNLFDTSTGYIKETSSNLKIESVMIINNAVTRYDESNKNWVRFLEISVWYSK